MRKVRLDTVTIVIPVDLYDSVGSRRSDSAINRDVADLLRAVQEHGWGKRAEIHRGVTAVCSFCGYAWGEAEDSPHNGGCCARDAANMPPDPDPGMTEAELCDPGEG